jgi:hypothetical protein
MPFLVIGLVLLGACGPGLAGQNAMPVIPKHEVRAGIPPATTEAGLRALMSREVTDGGLWFADSSCEEQFGVPQVVAATAFDAFARCVAELHLQPSGREDSIDDTSVLTYEPGFEVEARVIGGRLDYIGFAGRGPHEPALPTITPKALESLRVAGDPNVTLTPTTIEAMGFDLKAKVAPKLVQYLRICLADTGAPASIRPASTSTAEASVAFTALVRDWMFRPFVVDGHPTAACAIVGFHYPAADPARGPDRLPAPRQYAKSGAPVYIASLKRLESTRRSGSRLVIPDAPDKIHLNGKRLVSSFTLCLDETGHYESGTMTLSTGVPHYDAKIARQLMSWTFAPYELAGKPVPVCATFVFIYSQR